MDINSSEQTKRMYENLRVWRNQEAHQQDVPPYMVLPNETLRQIAKVQPQTLEELHGIEGLSLRKLNQYGSVILSIVRMGGVSAADFVEPKTDRARLSGIYHSAPQATGFVVGSALTVTILNKQILEIVKKSLKKRLGSQVIWVEGDVYDVRQYSEKRTYFDLIDEDGNLTCRIMNHDRDFELAAGQRVKCGGVVTVTPWRGNSWNILLDVQYIEYQGISLTADGHDQNRYVLEQRGFFDKYRHRSLPPRPERVALISFTEDSAVHDFNTAISINRHISVETKRIPERVAGQVAEMINHTDRLNFDLIVLATLENIDLEIFDDPIVVEAVATTTTPILVVIGSAPNLTLSHLAADSTADSATIAAQKVVELWKKEPVSPTTVFTYVVLFLAIGLLILISYFIVKKLGIF